MTQIVLDRQEGPLLLVFRQFQVSCVRVGQVEMNKQGNENTSELSAVHIQCTLKMFLLDIKQLQVL